MPNVKVIYRFLHHINTESCTYLSYYNANQRGKYNNENSYLNRDINIYVPCNISK